MRHRISPAHRPGRQPGHRRRAPGQDNASNDATRGSGARNGGPAVAGRACRRGRESRAGRLRRHYAHRPGHPPYQKELAYAHCMRAHGDPGFPDPQSNGAFISTKANRGAFSGPQAQSANKACAHLQGPRVSAVQFRQDVRDALKFVRVHARARHNELPGP